MSEVELLKDQVKTLVLEKEKSKAEMDVVKFNLIEQIMIIQRALVVKNTQPSTTPQSRRQLQRGNNRRSQSPLFRSHVTNRSRNNEMHYNMASGNANNEED